MPNTGRKIYIRRLVKFADSNETLRTEENVEDINYISPVNDAVSCPIGGDWTYTIWVDFKVENIVNAGNSMLCDINAYFYSDSGGNTPLSVVNLNVKWKQIREAKVNNPPIVTTETEYSNICNGVSKNLSSGLPYVVRDNVTNEVTDYYYYDIISTEDYGII